MHRKIYKSAICLASVVCRGGNGIHWISRYLLESVVGFLRATQQTVSVNICSEDLLSPTIFGLKCDEKTGVFNSNFCDMGNVMPLVFGEIKTDVVLDTKKGQLASTPVVNFFSLGAPSFISAYGWIVIQCVGLSTPRTTGSWSFSGGK